MIYEVITIIRGIEYVNLKTTDKKLAMDTYITMIINESSVRLRIDGNLLTIAEADKISLGSKQIKKPRWWKYNPQKKPKEKKVKKELTPENPCKRKVVQFPFLLGPECFVLCPDCAQDFNVFMAGRPLQEEKNESL